LIKFSQSCDYVGDLQSQYPLIRPTNSSVFRQSDHTDDCHQEKIYIQNEKIYIQNEKIYIQNEKISFNKFNI
jgi:Zn/Cd-binding protein ZinT